MRFRKIVRLGNREIGQGKPIFIIAEAGVNHFGSLQKAKALVDLAVDSGADAFKTQLFKTNKLISKESPQWRQRLKTKELSHEKIKRIKDYCDKKNIIFLATGHEEESVDFLESLSIPAFKIGSGEVSNWSYIDHVARKGKPIILSTGMYTLEDVETALKHIQKQGNNNVIVLHCVTRYPAKPAEIQLKAMDLLREKFNLPVGYSDHTEGWEIPLAAAAREACVIEKHITIDRNVPDAQDWKVSCGPDDFPLFVRAVRRVEEALGRQQKLPGKAEIESKEWARKSLVAKTKIPPKTIITREMLCTKRPGTGISPELIDEIIGKVSIKNIKADHLIKWEDIS